MKFSEKSAKQRYKIVNWIHWVSVLPAATLGLIFADVIKISHVQDSIPGWLQLVIIAILMCVWFVTFGMYIMPLKRVADAEDAFQKTT